MTRDPPSAIQQGLDDALAASFPASDPPAMTTPTIATTSSDDAAADAALETVNLYRVVSRKQAQAAFDSKANRSGGRWSSPGVPAVYASLSPAGAVLEFIAHVDGEKPVDLMLISASVAESCIVVAGALPPHWRDYPYRNDVRAFGDSWLASRQSLALQLPSVLCDGVQNLLINPDHDDVHRIKVTSLETFEVDPRLLKH